MRQPVQERGHGARIRHRFLEEADRPDSAADIPVRQPPERAVGYRPGWLNEPRGRVRAAVRRVVGQIRGPRERTRPAARLAGRVGQHGLHSRDAVPADSGNDVSGHSVGWLAGDNQPSEGRGRIAQQRTEA